MQNNAGSFGSGLFRFQNGGHELPSKPFACYAGSVLVVASPHQIITPRLLPKVMLKIIVDALLQLLLTVLLVASSSIPSGRIGVACVSMSFNFSFSSFKEITNVKISSAECEIESVDLY